MQMLSEDDRNLREMTPEELDAAWDLWFDLAQSTNDFDPPYTHGVFASDDRPGVPLNARDGGGTSQNATIRRLTDKRLIRSILSTEREWAIYALADLDEGLFEHCDWWSHGDALALVFHGIAIRPMFVMGSAGNARTLLAALPTESGYLNLPANLLPAAEGLYAFRRRHEMCRMILGRFRPRPGSTVPLTLADAGAIESLFTTGHGAGIAYAPAQLATGYFRGVRDHGHLVAVAGIQVVSLAEGVAAVGNVFVREDHRGRGLAQTVLSATVTAVRDAGIATIGLNVEHTNAPAVHAYENLGFRTAFHYFEGTADRVRESPQALGSLVETS
jgi:ribosomal protein S18 acetylase RimI-like enzyme